ncbi:ATP-binding cassette domain-containing protein [Streptomyces sp. CG4]|uniref:ATP-binding cassette domain-containing protein n=1 Tax=Streptomyces sp. CG4 TaxID=408783 RepID=UPI0034E249C6
MRRRHAGRAGGGPHRRLSRLLTGLYLPSSGAVTWDGTDLAQADPAGVWAKVGLVPQDYTRWPMDLRANIQLGQPRAEDDGPLLEAVRAASADGVIDKAPYGLDTLVASSNWGGTDVSGGQWQRIAVARAFHRDAAMLMLDEPTPAMDPRAQHLVIRRFKQLAKGKAAVFVTHTWRTRASRTASSSSTAAGSRNRAISTPSPMRPDCSPSCTNLLKTGEDRRPLLKASSRWDRRQGPFCTTSTGSGRSLKPPLRGRHRHQRTADARVPGDSAGRTPNWPYPAALTAMRTAAEDASRGRRAKRSEAAVGHEE